MADITSAAEMAKKQKDPNAVALGRKGGKARLQKMTPEQRQAIARKAVTARWAKAREKRNEKWSSPISGWLTPTRRRAPTIFVGPQWRRSIEDPLSP